MCIEIITVQALTLPSLSIHYWFPAPHIQRVLLLKQNMSDREILPHLSLACSFKTEMIPTFQPWNQIHNRGGTKYKYGNISSYVLLRYDYWSLTPNTDIFIQTHKDKLQPVCVIKQCSAKTFLYQLVSSYCMWTWHHNAVNKYTIPTLF